MSLPSSGAKRRTLVACATALVAAASLAGTSSAAAIVLSSPSVSGSGGGGSSGPVVVNGGGLGGTFKPTVNSAIKVDTVNERVTLPLLQGQLNGAPVYYVVTDDSDQADAARRGVNWAPKLANALVKPGAVQHVTEVGGIVQFAAGVHFGEARSVIPGPTGNEFAQGTFHQGATADPGYSPLITTGNGIVLNASEVAGPGTERHNSVTAIDFVNHTVTLSSFFGFWNGHQTLYLHLDATRQDVAAAEASTLAPGLLNAPGEASNDVKTSARSAIIPVVNGVTGVGNPLRQGLNSAVLNEGDPDNIQQEVPGQGNGRYTPVWDITPAIWTQAAINAGQRRVLTSGSDVAGAFKSGQIVSIGGNGKTNPDLGGLQAAQIISNCPIIAFT